MPRQTRKQVQALAPDDARAILAAFAGHELEALVTVALATGLRQGELLGLTWEAVDLDGGAVCVTQQLTRVNHAYTIAETKTGQSRRTLPLPQVGVSALRAHKKRQNERRLLLGPAWVDSALVFTNTTGGHLNGSAVTHSFQKQMEGAGLDRLTFHDLRHGAASLWLSQGASLRTVMEQLGHSTITLTANTYSYIVPALMRDAADKLDQALGG